MYWLYVKHHMAPSVYAHMDSGEKVVIRAFYLKELEDERREQAELKKLRR